MHFLTYGGALRYDTLRGNSGESLVRDFKVNVNMLAPRLIWVAPAGAGRQPGAARWCRCWTWTSAPTARASDSGLGDIAVGAALGYHASPALHYLFGVDVYAPTGKYDAKDPSSLGKNYWTIQPLAALTYTQPTGLNADLKVMYDFNQRNSDTRTRSGQAIHADYSLGWGLGGGLGGGWVAGVGGYVYQQVTDDKGPNSAMGKARALGVGPSIRYASQGGWLFTLKWQKDFEVRNRPEGNQLLAKLVIPF